MRIKEEAEKEMKRMIQIFENLTIMKKEDAKHFHSFAKDYFEDGKYFFEKKKYIEAFEAFIIAWAYIDAGMKINFFKVPKQIKKYFTVDN